MKMNGNKFVNGKELIKRNPQSAGGLHELVAKDFKGLLSDSQQAGKTKHGIGDGYFVQMSKNKPITVTYENLKANYNGTQITRAEFTYELLSSTSKDGKVGAYLFDDPSKTIVYGFKIGTKDKASARMKLSIRFFDKNGKEIKPEKGKPFAYSLASLNSRGEKRLMNLLKQVKTVSITKSMAQKLDYMEIESILKVILIRGQKGFSLMTGTVLVLQKNTMVQA